VIQGREGGKGAVTLTHFVFRVTKHMKELGRVTIGHKKEFTPFPCGRGQGEG
jgi:hypothetical protein